MCMANCCQSEDFLEKTEGKTRLRRSNQGCSSLPYSVVTSPCLLVSVSVRVLCVCDGTLSALLSLPTLHTLSTLSPHPFLRRCLRPPQLPPPSSSPCPHTLSLIVTKNDASSTLDLTGSVPQMLPLLSWRVFRSFLSCTPQKNAKVPSDTKLRDSSLLLLAPLVGPCGGLQLALFQAADFAQKKETPPFFAMKKRGDEV